MENSIIGTTYDLLTYHKGGNYGVFDRSFTKSLQFHSVQLTDSRKRYLRNWALHFLRTTGYIDVVRTGSETRWTVAPPSLVQRSNADFVLIGGAKEKEALIETAPAELITQISPAFRDASFPSNITFFPTIIKVAGSPEYVADLASQTGVVLTLDYQDRLFKHLPSMDSVYDEELVEWHGGSTFEPNSAKHFNQQDKTWHVYAEMTPLEPGLFRREYEYSAPDFFIAVRKPRARNLTILRIIDDEWVLACYYGKLNLKIPLRYDNVRGSLSIGRTLEGLRMPIIIERCLRSGTCMHPVVDQHWRTYENISFKNLWRLVAKIPIFEVKSA